MSLLSLATTSCISLPLQCWPSTHRGWPFATRKGTNTQRSFHTVAAGMGRNHEDTQICRFLKGKPFSCLSKSPHETFLHFSRKKHGLIYEGSYHKPVDCFSRLPCPSPICYWASKSSPVVSGSKSLSYSFWLESPKLGDL